MNDMTSYKKKLNTRITMLSEISFKFYEYDLWPHTIISRFINYRSIHLQPLYYSGYIILSDTTQIFTIYSQWVTFIWKLWLFLHALVLVEYVIDLIVHSFERTNRSIIWVKRQTDITILMEFDWWCITFRMFVLLWERE